MPIKVLRSSDDPALGVSTVEFAVSVIVLFIFVFGIIEIARVNMIRHAADNAAYEAARHAIVPGASALEAEAEAERLIQAVGIRDATVTISPDTITDDTNEVTVDIDVPLDTNVWLAASFTKGRQVAATATLMTERAPQLLATSPPAEPSDSPGDWEDPGDWDSPYDYFSPTPPPDPEPDPEPEPEPDPEDPPPPPPEDPPPVI